MAAQDTPSVRQTPHVPQTIEVPVRVDDRGRLCQILGTYPTQFPEVKRAYVVTNFAKGTVRGLHMHHEEWKAYYVVDGAAKFLIVSEDGTQKTSEVLSDRSNLILIVPPRLYHGWVSLTNRTTLIGFSNRTLEESEGDDYRLDPLSLGAEMWEVKPR